MYCHIQSSCFHISEHLAKEHTRKTLHFPGKCSNHTIPFFPWSEPSVWQVPPALRKNPLWGKTLTSRMMTQMCGWLGVYVCVCVLSDRVAVTWALAEPSFSRISVRLSVSNPIREEGWSHTAVMSPSRNQLTASFHSFSSHLKRSLIARLAHDSQKEFTEAKVVNFWVWLWDRHAVNELKRL